MSKAEVASYIASAPKEAQARMKQMREILRKALPDAEERLGYGVPAFSSDKPLVMYGAFKKHIGFYPTPSVLVKFSAEIKKLGLKSAKGSVQLPHDKPLPSGLITKMAKLRAKNYLVE